MKRFLSVLCVLAMLLSIVPVAAFAAAQDLQALIDAGADEPIVLEADASNITVTRDTYVDLNGHDIDGVTVLSGTLYCLDSQTADYTVADGVYGKVTNATGAVKAAEGYLQVGESFHAVNLDIYAMTLRAADVGVYYKSNFAADEIVAAQVESFGVALSVVTAPNASNLDSYCGYSVFEGFEAGEGANSVGTSTLLKGIMKASNGDNKNAKNASMPVYGRAYIKTADGYFFGETVKRSLQEQVEAIDKIWNSLTDSQKNPVLGLLESYTSVMESWNIPNIMGIQVPGAEGEIEIDVPVNAENGTVTEAVTVEQDGVSVTVPAGTKLSEGAEKLTVTVTPKEVSDAGLTLEESEVLMPMDVHVDGLAADNAAPLTIYLGKVMAENLNMGNYAVYHVENGKANEMTLIGVNEEFTAHNQYKYTLDGELTLYVANFSEFALLSNEENKWNGDRDYSWYDADAKVLEIRNADQLAGLSAIVGGMANTKNDDELEADIAQDSFEGQKIVLLADINIGDLDSENGIVFYPIGYNSDDGKYEKTGVAVSTGFYAFQGTFDGNGNTISNFYQNTWEMKGDHNWYDATLQYYRDGMGLFGKVYGGTVKNLTVDSFSCDSEIGTAGTIAAYAEGATFENIAIFNCNPRVYNIGNGGIVGCVGWYAKEANLKTTFTNITVDNSNKISALWGTYDAACGGIVGQYYPTSGQSSANYPVNAGIHFENCHVSAQMDVFNDVCANYQYYAYRYTGMLIGSVRENETIGGHVYPKMDGITAEDCTVHFGDWNDYYYCELVDNTTASYTHDYQMSRLIQVKAVEGTTITPLEGENFTVPTSGRVNYVVVNKTNDDGTFAHASENATCYHFKDGEVWTHDMAGLQDGIDENGDGQIDLKEDKQHIYLEFNNLVTGYGWGVTSKGVDDMDGVIILDREVGNSYVKFEGLVTEAYNNKEIKLGDIFKATTIEDEKLTIESKQVQVTVSPADPADTAYNVVATYEANTTDWTQGTLTFTGTGDAKITITDYYFCTPTTINVTIKEREPEEKFDVVMNNGDFLHRVGNSGTVALNKLFKAKEGVTVGTISVTVDAVGNTIASGTYSDNAIQFNNTGVVKVSITDNDYCIPTVLYLEVVDAKNVITAESATANNVVLLNDIGSGFTVSGRYTVYGNGFTLNYTGNGQYLNNGLKQGVVTVSENGTLDNLRIKATIYPTAYMYYGSNSFGEAVQDGPSSVEGDKTRYHYQLSAVAASGNATISNCYIYGGRNNIFINTGDVTVKDTVLECAPVANVQIQSNSSHTVTFENVTTIQYQVNPTLGDTSKIMLGTGILVGPETNDNPEIVLNDDFKQYNWVNSDDSSAVSDTKVTKAIIDSALKATAYNHTVNGKTASNLCIIYMNEYDVNVENNTGLPYALDTVTLTLSGNSVNGQVCSVQNATAEQIYSDYENADRSTVNGWYQPQFKYLADLGGQYIAEGGDEHCYREGDTIHVMFPSGDTKELDLAKLVDIQKYTGQDLNLAITCKDENGNAVTVTAGKVALFAAGEYTVTYTVTDTLFYDKDGNAVERSAEYSWNVMLSVSLKDTKVPDAYFEFDATKQVMGYAKKSLFAGGNTQYLPFLAGLKIYDYNGQVSYLRFDGDNDFNKVASVTITGYTSANHVLIEVKLTDGGVINIDTTARAASGGSTYTGKIQTSGSTIYYVNDGTTSATTTTWVISSYKFTGNNGVEINSGTVTFANCENGSVPTGSFSTTIKYTVTYDANEGNCGQAVGYATSASAAVTLPTPTRSGYLCVGWFTAASGGNKVGDAGATYTPTENVTLYAQWGKPSTVTYNANGGSVTPTSAKYEGVALTLPTPTRDGYWCTGWYDAAEGGKMIGNAGAPYQATGDITLYAQWSPVYTVTYNANGGNVSPTSAEYMGTALTLPMPEWMNHTFLGWYTAVSGGSKVGDAGASYTPSANTTIYAQWKSAPIVTYNANGGSVTPASATYTNTPLTLPTPTRDGYWCTGWYTEVSGGTMIGDKGASYTPDADITLYAQWSPIYTVTYNANSGSVSPDSAEYKGAALTLPTPTRSGYTFQGWYTAASNGTKVGGAGASYTPTANITLYAQWKEDGCVTPDTLVTLADGTQKEIQYVTYEDQLLVWNFVTGAYDVKPVATLINMGEGYYDVIHLLFNDGTVIKMIDVHGFYNRTLNKYVFIDESNVNEFVGHEFAKMSGKGFEAVELVGYSIENEFTTAYSILSGEHYNAIVEGYLSVTPFPGVDNEAFYDCWPMDDDMTYDEEKMQEYIAQYGLYTYEELSEYGVTYQQYVGANLAYLKVIVSRGGITLERALNIIFEFMPR